MVSSLIKRKVGMGNISNEFLLEMMEVLDKSCKRNNEAMDYIYETLKEEHDNRANNSDHIK
jgi:hypothetical protein